MISRRSLIQRMAAVLAVPTSAVAAIWNPKTFATAAKTFSDSFTWTIPYPVAEHSKRFAARMMKQMEIVTGTDATFVNGDGPLVMSFSKTGLTPELHAEIDSELLNLSSHIPDFSELWPFNDLNLDHDIHDLGAIDPSDVLPPSVVWNSLIAAVVLPRNVRFRKLGGLVVSQLSDSRGICPDGSLLVPSESLVSVLWVCDDRFNDERARKDFESWHQEPDDTGFVEIDTTTVPITVIFDKPPRKYQIGEGRLVKDQEPIYWLPTDSQDAVKSKIEAALFTLIQRTPIPKLPPRDVSLMIWRGKVIEDLSGGKQPFKWDDEMLRNMGLSTAPLATETPFITDSGKCRWGIREYAWADYFEQRNHYIAFNCG